LIGYFQLEKFIEKNSQQSEELANVIAILKILSKESTNSQSDQMEPNLKQESSQNTLERHRLPLPLELNCQIFECLKVQIQKKFICGLGRGIYGICREKVLTKVGFNNI
jgi:hypothetical protein